MTTIPKDATVHEKTVQAVAAGKPPLKAPPRRRRSTDSTEQVLSATYTRVQPDLWRMVKDLRIAPNHVQVLAWNDVIVWNHPAPWPWVKPPSGL